MCRGFWTRTKKKKLWIKGSVRGQSEWDLDFKGSKEVESEEKLWLQESEDEVIADEEGKVASSEEERVKMTPVSLLDLPWEKSRKMERSGENVPGREEERFQRGSLQLTRRVMGGKIREGREM